MNRRWLLLPAILLGVPTFMFAQSTPGTFAYTGSMSIPRNQATATLITGCNCPADGKVLVTGGVISSGDIAFTTNTAELYDPASGTFTPTGSMNVARSGQAAVLLLGGKVLIVGAFNAQGPVDAEIYDPVAGTFSCVAGLDPSTASCNSTLVHNALSVTATMLQNGKVLIAGLPTPSSFGQSSTAAAIYDPSQSNITCVSGMSSTPGICNSSMASFHGSGTATLLADGTVLVAGGFDPNSGYTNSAELYDPTVSPNGAFSITA
ncbi:MAG TPA: kelch repeat-containing protein, partial [Bacteroidota bacterium]|nr:kelch repeat-containing protein [Bacteroidota bacterium]